MTCCRTVAEVRAAANADAQGDPPLDQNTADHAAAVIAGATRRKDAA